MVRATGFKGAVSDRLRLRGQGTACIAGVDGADGFYQQNRGFIVCAGAVFDAAGDNKQLSLFHLDVAVAGLDRQVPREDEEEFVGVVVPDELAFTLTMRMS